ncbi:transcriptional regulator [Shewanella sp. NIFS-20-20]|uniref:helix-turn-helix transcriptional regulator n=1 Tax=Shewanella sp. NIFS-20-20 TaxID=2853806 RepID=UPI001C478AE6|nr:PAS domain-containing protein [Shewanella sp. NIFS-20-20]MBV7314058.1 PAS domain-containing protein [Shewanella sp. NIFS-20-20]
MPDKIIRTEFTPKDRELLEGYFRLAESMADLIGPHCEVVIHSLESFEKSVVKIVNGHHTGRTEGSPITDLGLKMLRLYEQTGEVTPKSYFSHNKDGSLLKSSTCILSGDGGKPIGMFCVNMNLSFPFPEIMKTLMPDMTQHPSLTVTENFSASAGDVVEQALQHAVSDVDADPTVNLKGRNKAITKILFDNGIFELKEATNIVANQLSITKHAVYKYIREFKS